MRLGQCTVKNFGSYKNLDFNYADPGLTLIYGKTGSGKSTLPDIACWALYGITARGGNVADICSWTSDGEPTRVELWVAVDRPIQVVRVRGTPKENDLYWVDPEVSGDPIRGKDINDTQKKLVARLGVDADSFITSAYLHEFSEAGNFFTLRAKDRRYLFERIANLDLPSRLAEASSAKRKEVKGQIATSQRELDKLEGKLNQLIATHEKHQRLSDTWKDDQVAKIASLEKTLAGMTDNLVYVPVRELERLQDKFVMTKDALVGLKAKRCGECGGPKHSEEYDEYLTLKDSLTAQIQSAERNNLKCDSYTKEIHRLNKQVEELRSQEHNPWTKSIEEGVEEITSLDAFKEELSLQMSDLILQETSLDQLYDLSSTLRGELLRRTVKQIEHETNRYLETYFDAEIRVEFNIDSKKDDIEVGIKKSGYDAVYTQLSKGQRSLLRLCFSVSVMEQCANKTGIHQDCLFFDEFTDGLDEVLKEKVFGLLSELETRHSTVVVIDHSTGFQNMFNKKLRVTMEGDTSYVQSEDTT